MCLTVSPYTVLAAEQNTSSEEVKYCMNTLSIFGIVHTPSSVIRTLTVAVGDVDLIWVRNISTTCAVS